MDKMQEEAIRRVSQMQSGNSPNRNQSINQNTNHSQTQNRKQIENPPETTETKSELAQKSAENQDPLSGLFGDKEKLLILLLIMLLSQDGTNVELVLALLYIII